jgi:hypothetical protein
MSSWDSVAALPLHIDGYALEGLERDVSSAFTRKSTVIRLHGGEHEGVGEDVTYDGEDHDALQAAGPGLPLAGDWTLESFCDHVEALGLWPEPPRGGAGRPAPRGARPRATTASGRTSPLRWISRCARPARPSTRRSAASRGR